MTENKCKGRRINLQEIFGADKDGFKELLREVLQEVLEQEMTDALGAEKGERSPRAPGISFRLLQPGFDNPGGETGAAGAAGSAGAFFHPAF